jgi:hypothetical protein
MEQIAFEQTAQKLVQDLEGILAKLAVASQAGLSTYYLEPEAQKLSAKLKASAEALKDLPLYKDVKTNNEIYASAMNKLPDSIYMAYASLSKKCKDTDMDIFKDEEKYFVKFADNLFINLDDLPHEAMPKFKVKLEGNTLMAVRTDLYNQLPKKTQELLDNGKGGDNE